MPEHQVGATPDARPPLAFRLANHIPVLAFTLLYLCLVALPLGVGVLVASFLGMASGFGAGLAVLGALSGVFTRMLGNTDGPDQVEVKV